MNRLITTHEQLTTSFNKKSNKLSVSCWCSSINKQLGCILRAQNKYINKLIRWHKKHMHKDSLSSFTKQQISKRKVENSASYGQWKLGQTWWNLGEGQKRGSTRQLWTWIYPSKWSPIRKILFEMDTQAGKLLKLTTLTGFHSILKIWDIFESSKKTQFELFFFDFWKCFESVDVSGFGSSILIDRYLLD